MKRYSVLACSLIAGLPALALAAADVTPPAWRGQPMSTYQAWDFNVGVDGSLAAIGLPADIASNAYGAPSVDVVTGMWAAGWYWELPRFGNARGYWDMGDAGTITANVPNIALPAGSTKEIWVQVGAYTDGGIFALPAVSLDGASLLSTDLTVYENAPSFGTWAVQTTKWSMSPSPAGEQVVLTSAMMGGIIDSLVIDTIAVPEPTALLGLLAIASMLIARRRA